MNRFLAFVTQPERDLAKALGALPGVTLARSSGPLLPGSFGPADHVVDVVGGDATQVGEAIVRRTRSALVAVLHELDGAAPEPALAPAVKRVLVFTVADGTPPATVARFERALARMPQHIPAIRSWSLSRVERVAGDVVWTHAWEQEYVDLASFRTYMDSPYHWGVIEPWFDHEFPQAIVEPQLAQVFYDVDRSLLASAGRSVPCPAT